MATSYEQYMKDAKEKAHKGFISARSQQLFTLRLSRYIPEIIDSIYDELNQEIDPSLRSKLGGLSRQQVQNAIIGKVPLLVDNAKSQTVAQLQNAL